MNNNTQSEVTDKRTLYKTTKAMVYRLEVSMSAHEGANTRADRPKLSRNVERRLRHKLIMEYFRTSDYSPTRHDEMTHDVAYVFGQIASVYAQRRDGALWLDRELKAKRSYEYTVDSLPLGAIWPERPLLYKLFDEAISQ